MKQISLFLQATSESGTYRSSFLRNLLISGILIELAFTSVKAQTGFEQTAPSKYRIAFTDKNNTPYNINSPAAFLSQKAVDRRLKHGIDIVYNDLPVNPSYIDSLSACGARVINVSKWLNSATIEVSADSVLEKINRFTFVKKETVQVPANNSNKHIKVSNIQETTSLSSYNYGPSLWQTSLHNGQWLHNNGLTGKNVVIAIIDAGFLNADILPAFDDLWQKGQILGTRDFVSPGNNVFAESGHGMAVLSLIGGNLPEQLIGTAPDAFFWLLRSEDVTSEYIIEEDNWVAAAEFADSAGADIINTSLGYTTFDDASQDHSYADMDGNTTRVSQAADIAASKGILVVVSAGNEGNTPWRFISAPADADSVITVGAVDFAEYVTAFSGRGPSSDQQIKPTVMAMGEDDYVADVNGDIRTGNGTSFSAPIICGLSACLLQGNPNAGMMNIYAAICQSADRFFYPDNCYGYGIPDFSMAHLILQAENNPGSSPVLLFPNPFEEKIFVFFKSEVNNPIDISLFDISGKEVFRKIYPLVNESKYVVVEENTISTLRKGVYIIRVRAGEFSSNAKLIKL